MEIKRNQYLDRLLRKRHNGMIKVITGLRRCGKSYLLFRLFRNRLKEMGIDDSHIIPAQLDDWMNRDLHHPDALYQFVKSKIQDDGMYYVLLDEIQLVPQFEDVLNGFLHIPNIDVYVTGSNARFLSKDVITEFRGRGDEVKMYPLSFKEFCSVYDGRTERALDEYMTYGGLPFVLSLDTTQDKASYLKNLFTETYIKDITERYHVRQEEELGELMDFIASSVGSLTNPKKLANTFKSKKNADIAPATIKSYLEYICDSFLAEKALRYDVKGKRYIDTPQKYYFSDMGLRNARLNFRQMEKAHIMENVLFNELLIRGFNVDVGVVPIVRIDKNGARKKAQLEIDFVCNQESRRYYIQSAFRMESDEKAAQEQASLLRVRDSFKKIIVTGEDSIVHRDDNGITTMSIYDFLLNENSLEL